MSQLTTPLASPSSPIADSDNQFTRILRSWTDDLGVFSNYRLVRYARMITCERTTYNRSNIRILQVRADKDGLNEEFILALGIGSRFLLHGL